MHCTSTFIECTCFLENRFFLNRLINLFYDLIILCTITIWNKVKFRKFAAVIFRKMLLYFKEKIYFEQKTFVKDFIISRIFLARIKCTHQISACAHFISMKSI